jgi:hypothetical protein
MGNDDTTRLEIMLARVEERQKADQDSTAHFRANMKQVMGEIVPRREITQMNEALHDKIDANNDAIVIRVVKLEDAVETARTLALEAARAAAIKSGGIGAGIATSAMAMFYAVGKKFNLV